MKVENGEHIHIQTANSEATEEGVMTTKKRERSETLLPSFLLSFIRSSLLP